MQVLRVFKTANSFSLFILINILDFWYDLEIEKKKKTKRTFLYIFWRKYLVNLK